MTQNKRRIYLINKEFQFKFILYTSIPSIFSLIIFYISLNTYFTKLFAQGVASGFPPHHTYFIFLEEQKSFMHSLFFICFVCLTLFYVAWGLFLSHKIAGPLYRLTKFFKDMEASEFQGQISFRPDDFFQEIPPAINEWLRIHYAKKGDSHGEKK